MGCYVAFVFVLERDLVTLSLLAQPLFMSAAGHYLSFSYANISSLKVIFGHLTGGILVLRERCPV
jgi:hypothetical protein